MKISPPQATDSIDSLLKGLLAQISKRNQRLREKDRVIGQREQSIIELQKQLVQVKENSSGEPEQFAQIEAERNRAIQEIAQLVEEREQLRQEVGGYQVRAQEQQQVLLEKERSVAQLVEEREGLTKEILRYQVRVQEQQQVLLEKERSVAQLVEERERLTKEIHRHQVRIQEQQLALAKKEQTDTQFRAEREHLTQNLTHLQNTVESQQRLLGQNETERHRLSQESSQLKAILQTREVYLRTIEDSLAWRLLVKYRKVRDKFYPDGTRRRRIYNAIKNTTKKLALRQVLIPEAKQRKTVTNDARVWKLPGGFQWLRGRLPWVRHPSHISSAVILASSGLIQESWYIEKNKDVATSGMSALFHYLLYGAREGRDPNPFFDTSWYLEQNKDVARNGMNPLLHYLRHGAWEGRDPSPLFDTSYYLERNFDVAISGINPLAHYLSYGVKEGRVPRPPEAEHNSSLYLDLSPATENYFGPEPYSTVQMILRPPPPDPPWVLIVSDRVPTPDLTSGSVRLSAILQLIHELGLRISFISTLRKEEYRFILEPGRELSEYEEPLRALGVRKITYGWDDAIQELKQNGWRYRFAFISFAEITYRYLPVVRASAIHAKVIYDTVDLHALRVGREAEVNGSRELAEKGAYYHKIELCNMQCADAVIAVTDEEARRIRELAPQARVATIPNIHEVSFNEASMQKRQDLLFIGHYLHTPNVDAVKFFVSEILPRVRKVLPNVTIRLLGSNIPQTIRALGGPGVLPIGYAKDVRPYFDASRIFVAPLRYGAGMKGKIGHAMSWGLPVVTTSIGAEGMGIMSGEHALIADNPEAFADAIIQLYNDQNLWEHISLAAAKHIRDRFSIEAVRPVLKKLFLENFYDDNDRITAEMED